MASNLSFQRTCDAPISSQPVHCPLPSRHSSHSNATHTSQRQPSESTLVTPGVVLFENASTSNPNEIRFQLYQGTRARRHHTFKLYLPQLTQNNGATSANDAYYAFAKAVKSVLPTIPAEDLSSYVVSVRTGVFYFFSKGFDFRNTCTTDDIRDLMQKSIPPSDPRFYRVQSSSINSGDESLRSSFCNVKPISDPKAFAEKLRQFQFLTKDRKHVYRVYLQSDDKQAHVCTIDPTANYSIVEFSKDFQRVSNIDFVRDRHCSKFCHSKTYDDVFDFRIQFQYNPRTHRDKRATIEYELRQQFPNLDDTFTNAQILYPAPNSNDDTLYISEQLFPYVKFVRRDFGDIYHFNGNDDLLEDFNIYLESSVEYRIDYNDKTCKRELDAFGVVYARLDLSTLMHGNTIDKDRLVDKLWEMGIGLTDIAGQCTTSVTQQATNYYTRNGERFNAQDETIVQRIMLQSFLRPMLDLPKYAKRDEIEKRYHHLLGHLNAKGHYLPRGLAALDKLTTAYENYLKELD